MEHTELLQFYAQLTERQQDVVQLVTRGYSNAQVADLLVIQPSVVAGHLTVIYDKLHVFTGTDNRPNRFVIVRLFTLLFERYPELEREYS